MKYLKNKINSSENIQWKSSTKLCTFKLCTVLNKHYIKFILLKQILHGILMLREFITRVSKIYFKKSYISN